MKNLMLVFTLMSFCSLSTMAAAAAPGLVSLPQMGLAHEGGSKYLGDYLKEQIHLRGAQGIWSETDADGKSKTFCNLIFEKQFSRTEANDFGDAVTKVYFIYKMKDMTNNTGEKFPDSRLSLVKTQYENGKVIWAITTDSSPVLSSTVFQEI